jgi:hypothetical protein
MLKRLYHAEPGAILIYLSRDRHQRGPGPRPLHVNGLCVWAAAAAHALIPSEVTMVDLRFTNHGSIVTMVPETEAGEEWMQEHIGDDLDLGRLS